MRRSRPVAAAALAAALAPAAAAALEPRYDHRDEQGPFVELLLARDTVSASGIATESAWQPALRLAWGVDVTGEGGELVLGGQLRPWAGGDGSRSVRAALDLRYRGYFGLDEWKTFFEAGVWAPVASRLAVGPSIGIGAAYDFSRAGGLYAALGFGTAFGGYRVVTYSLSAGAQLRFD